MSGDATKTRNDVLAFVGAALLLAAVLWWSVRITTELLEDDNAFVDAALKWGEALCARDYDSLFAMGFRMNPDQPRPVEFDAAVGTFLDDKIGRGETCTASVFFPTSHEIAAPAYEEATGKAWRVEVRLTTTETTYMFVRVVAMTDGRYLISPDEYGLEAISRWNGWIYDDSFSLELFGTYGGTIKLDAPQVLEGQTMWAVGIPYQITGGALHVRRFNVRALNTRGMKLLARLEQPFGVIRETSPFEFPIAIREERWGTWWFTVPTDQIPDRILLDVEYDSSSFSVEPVLPPVAQRGVMRPFPLSVTDVRLEHAPDGERLALLTFEVDEALIAPSMPFEWRCEDFELRWEESGTPLASGPKDCSFGRRYYAIVDGRHTRKQFELVFQSGQSSSESLDFSLYIVDEWSEAPNAFQRLLFDGLARPDLTGQLEPTLLHVPNQPRLQDVGDGNFAALFEVDVDLSAIDADSFFRWSCQNFQLHWEENGVPRTGGTITCPERGAVYYPADETEAFRLAMQAPTGAFIDVPVKLVFSRNWSEGSASPQYTLYYGLIRQ